MVPPRIARLERPLLVAGLALVVLHLLDLTFSGSHTTVLGVLAILGLPLLWFAAQPLLTRPTRLALGVVFGLLATGFGVASHGLHAVNSGLDRYDVFHRCQTEGVAAGPVADEADLHADPQLRQRGFFRRLSSPHTGEHVYPTHGVNWSGPPLRWDRHPPGLGEDNEYVYKQVLRLSDEEYEELVAQGHLSEDYLDPTGRPL